MVSNQDVAALRVGSSVFVDEYGKFFGWRGDTAFRNSFGVNDALQCFDSVTERWSNITTKGESIPTSVTGAGVTVVNGKAYLFGGFTSVSDGGTPSYYRDLFELCLETYQWNRLVPVNDPKGPINKYLFGMGSLNNGSILIFGGFGHKHDEFDPSAQPWAQYDWSDEFSATWTNELHIYNPSTNQWVSPLIAGIKPSPGAAFCFSKIDRHRFVMFGGRQRIARVNEVQILDTRGWEWSGPILPSSGDVWPEPRSLHTGVPLLDPEWLDPPRISSTDDVLLPYQKEQQLLVIWGQSRSSDQLSDVWILKLSSLKWNKLDIKLKGKKWHSTGVFYPSPDESLVVTVGGFVKDEVSWLCPKHSDALIMKFGIPSLYSLCIKYFTTLMEMNESLLNFLPKRVANDIERACNSQKQQTATSDFKPYAYLDYTAKVVNRSSVNSLM